MNAAREGGGGRVLVDLFEFCLFVFSFHKQDVVDGITTVKFVFITWVGENVKPMTKGKISTHKSTIDKAFHVSFVIKNNTAITNSTRVLPIFRMFKFTSRW